LQQVHALDSDTLVSRVSHELREVRKCLYRQDDASAEEGVLGEEPALDSEELRLLSLVSKEAKADTDLAAK
jgi:hypothetical protein